MAIKNIIADINKYKSQLAELGRAINTKHNESFSVFGIYLKELEYDDTSLRTEIISTLRKARQVYESRLGILENHMETLDKIAKSFTDSDVDKV